MNGLTCRNDGWWFGGRKQRSRLGRPRTDLVVVCNSGSATEVY